MDRRHHQVGRYVASETEPDGVGQRKLEEVDETGIGHLRALSPWLLMMMMMMMRLVHTASQPSSLSRVYTVFYWLTGPNRAKDASFIINSCKPLFERRV